MFNIYLNKNNLTNYAIKKYGKFDYIRRRYLAELAKVKEYYRNKDRAVENRHILSRLINMVSPSIHMDDIQYLKIVSGTSRHISKQFDIVSNIHSGKIMENLFFGKESYEILLYKETPLDIEELKHNWVDKSAIHVIYTEETNLDFKIPFNDSEYVVPVLNIMEIDINLLLIQYKYWSLNRLKHDMSINANVFISQIVLPNMLDNMLDFAIYNRYIAIANGTPIESFTMHQPFTVIDYSKGIDKVLTDVVKNTKDQPMYTDEFYKNIPTINNTVYELLGISHTHYTKQSEWVLVLARLPIIKDTITILGKRGRAKNKGDIYKLKYILKAIDRSKTIENKLTVSYLETNYMYDLDIVKDIIKK